jgi:hypothetical protein
MNKVKVALRFFLLSFVFSACKEDESILITYTDIQPDKSITSMVSYPWISQEFSDNNLFLFSNVGVNGFISMGGARLGYDLDKDGSEDFVFTVQHAYKNILENLPYDQFVIHIGILNESFGISLDEYPSTSIKRYLKGETMDNESFGGYVESSLKRGGYIIRYESDYYEIENSGEFYVAVKMIIDGLPHYGWFLVEAQNNPLKLTIKEFAMCKVPEEKILIGQKK